MNKILLFVVSTTLMIVSHQGIAKSSIQDNTIKTKCFVTLYGGQKTILYQIINAKELSQLPKTLTNSTTMTTLSEEKQKVYKVTECTKSSEPFKNKFAQAVEKITPQ
ncbi:TapY2 family type IVa secretion system protein [Thalassotalea castellviae]|uniref:TapY2 family type IVa secretion system protein n=1 Tax=Thalassotalea castellviae TaxID=3075612 RepID=A0ABU2ZXP8_9GAMM|nr:TapY2 family type IVa secretion system protein [Thalassotalea sp. W431]MDT0602403.1 TapY2 family type IVa secretion system protein [Thalassotalea sp. W431]